MINFQCAICQDKIMPLNEKLIPDHNREIDIELLYERLITAAGINRSNPRSFERPTANNEIISCKRLNYDALMRSVASY